MSSQCKRTERISLRVAPELAEQLDRLAAANGHTRASLAAFAVRLFVEAVTPPGNGTPATEAAR